MDFTIAHFSQHASTVAVQGNFISLPPKNGQVWDLAPTKNGKVLVGVGPRPTQKAYKDGRDPCAHREELLSRINHSQKTLSKKTARSGFINGTHRSFALLPKMESSIIQLGSFISGTPPLLLIFILIFTFERLHPRLIPMWKILAPNQYPSVLNYSTKNPVMFPAPKKDVLLRLRISNENTEWFLPTRPGP